MIKENIFEENKETQSSLFLAQSYQDAWADYSRALKKERFARWDYVVLTASNEEQSEGFKEQIKKTLSCVSGKRYIECRINADDTQADKAEVFYTRCLKEFPFPEYRNEKFLGEDLVWIRMAMKYQMVHINRAIYVGNYLEDGLTKNRRKNNIRSPYGCMERAKEFMRPELKLKYRLKGAVQYFVYGKFAGEKQLIAKAPYKGLAVCAALPSMLVYHIWSKSI